MGLLRDLSSWVSGMGTQGTARSIIGGGRAYEGGAYGTRETGDWWPDIGSADDEILANRDLLVARARDLYRNHPVIHGAVNKIADAVIGSKVMLTANPAHELLSRNLEWALEWGLSTQAEFKVWAYGPGNEADLAMQAMLGDLARTAFISRVVDGECIALLRNVARPVRYTTCIELVDPDRLSNPDGKPDGYRLENGNTLYAGIEFDRNNSPVAYYFRKKHPKALVGAADMDRFTWVRVERFAPSGKQQVLHSFRSHRVNQRRGVSALAAILKRVRMNDNYDIAELEAALFDAINAGFVESPYPTADVAQGMAPGSEGDETMWSFAGQLAHRAKNAVSLKGVRMIHGLPGEKFNWKAPARPAGNYPAFKGAGQHDAAAGLGLSYPQLSEDWAAINYSSARTLLNEKWRGFESIGQEFAGQFLSPIYWAWLEEAVAIGTVKVPGGAGRFYQIRPMLGMCGWLRPGRGTIDPLKEEQAADIAIHGGRSSTALECAKNGLDHYEVLRAVAEERLLREKLGLPQFVPMKIAGAAGGGDEGGDAAATAGTVEDRDGDGVANEEQQRRRRQAQ